MIRKMNEVLPFDWFFIHLEKGIFSCSSSFIGDKPPNWDFTNELVKEVPKNILFLLLILSPLKPSTEFFQDFFFLQGQKNLLMF